MYDLLLSQILSKIPIRKTLETSFSVYLNARTNWFQAVRIFFPAMFISCSITLGVGLLSLAQFFWIKHEIVGAAESKLNNIFGLVRFHSAFKFENYLLKFEMDPLSPDL